MSFIRNHWYAGAWSHEIGPKPLGRKILGEDVVFFRTASGKAAALSSACPHRFAPLEYGSVDGENLKCRYHGLQFGADGKCAVDPSGAKPPPMRVRSFPVAEKHAMVYVWIGDGEPSRPAPDWLDFGPGYGGVLRGVLGVQANFQLMIDNLMDDAHATHLHELLRTEGHIARPTAEVNEAADGVFIDIDIHDTSIAPLFRPMYRKPGNVSQLVRLAWREPSAVNIKAGVYPIRGNPDENVGVNSAHMLTPATATSCHYFWSFSRNAYLEDHAFTEKMSQMLANIFRTEDIWMVEGQQLVLGNDDFFARKPALMRQDLAATVVRRRVDKLLAAAAAEAAPATAAGG